MKVIELLDTKYELVRNDKDCFNMDEVREKVTDYFIDYDYIFGDYAYDKVRLKGYYDIKNKKVSEVNNIKNIDKYISDYCSYGARTFLLKKIK